jgi:hypothetical protein
MISTLSTTRVLLTQIGKPHATHGSVVMRWIGPTPSRPPSPMRVLLAVGIWIVPERAQQFNSPKWMDFGLCARLPTKTSDAMFFGVERRAAPGVLIAATNTAQQLCAQCPVANTCLAYALLNDERYGVWGGTSGRQRRKLQRQFDAGADVDALVAAALPKAINA